MKYPTEYRAMSPHPQLLIRIIAKSAISVCVVLVLFVVGKSVLTQAYLPPETFPVNESLRIEEGMTAEDTAHYLKEVDALRSANIFTYTFKKNFADKYIQAGTYTFTEPLPVEELIKALVTGSYSSPDIRVTFPEGFRVDDIPRYIPDSMEITEGVLALAREGYLFPDTYHLESDTTLAELIQSMEENYEVKIAPFREAITASRLSESEVVILASILEREANDPVSMGLVSGILQNRLALGMPLQVDAAFEYILGKTSAELTLEDLALDSPYNTYINTGLPPTPISNPGLSALKAVIEPTPSDFLYYLTGDDGVFYYAETFEEHKVNKARHLRQ